MDIQKQIAFEKFQAKDSNCDYEELKQRLDHFEKLSGHRYLPTSPRHEAWLVWNAAWQAKAQAVPEKDAIIKKLSDQLYSQEMKTSAARTLCETACELLDDYAHQDAMVILNDLEQAMIEAQEQKG